MIIFDWLAREGWILVSWWLLVTLAGLAVMPLCLRFLRGLPDRGYSLARLIGLLLVAYVFWMLASLGFLPNTTGSMLIAWLIVLGFSAVIFLRQPEEGFSLRQYWRDNRALIICGELLFVLLFFGWALFRAYQNDTASTEKAMEMAFISGIMRSPTFPPQDPWMAGYSISYYYFGYVMSAMLSMLSGVRSSIGFSMTSAMWFALAGLAAFGVVANMVRARLTPVRFGDRSTEGQRPAGAGPVLAGLLATICVILLGNFQLALIEVPYQARSASPEYLDFWATPERSNVGSYVQTADALSFSDPGSWGSWWWFRASRVLSDFALDGGPAPSWWAQPISEFPAFSFLLSDNHPHVLALPFVIMVLGLALNLILLGRKPERWHILLYALLVGGLVFLNTWDGPIYIAAFIGAEALRRLLRSASHRLQLEDWLALVGFGLTIVGITLIAYLPFLIGFRSQAGGIIPNPLYTTYFPQFFIMMGPLLLLCAAFVAVESWRAAKMGRLNLRLGFGVALSVWFGLAFFMGLLILIGLLIPQFQSLAQNMINEAGGWAEALPLFLARRLRDLPTSLILLIAIGLVVARLFARSPAASAEVSPATGAAQSTAYAPATGFALLLIGIGAGLLLLPEFVYLRDNFGTRINTVFKFYYQAWIVLSLASAYGAYSILATYWERRPTLSLRFAYGIMLGLILLMGLAYPVFGVYHRSMVETGRVFLEDPASRPLTVDGFTTALQADEVAVLQCLEQLTVNQQDLVVAEAVGGPYNVAYGRVGTFTGLPVLLGWANHERQWRGETYGAIAGTREQDIERLYRDLRWDVAVEIIQRYGIDYIIFGQPERLAYDGADEQKFLDYLPLVCESGNTRIYRAGPDLRFVPS